ncbi:hypothetical protein [Kitasatospora sp. NPDC088346]|uniref:hypothetical protein n=1 Tax=Kitasatospora sp. NPDC088346 TaxID=3364073 RepID=UPI003805282C
MTRYCVDLDRRELIATWGTGEGDLATRIALLPAEASTTALLSLARTLTQLSDAAWRTYTHPTSATDGLETDTEDSQPDQERKRFDDVVRAISQPNLPHGGTMTVSYSPVLESANRIGRALVALDSPELTQAVLTEASVELAAIENAELGDLTGRAQQAVLLSREGASPAQVAAANHLFEQEPFGSKTLFSAIDPTAAAVAAAHWLAAAAEVAAEASGQDPTTVVLEADNIEALPHETPTLVLELLESGASPYDAVTGLVRHAMNVADGLLPDPAALREQLDNLDEALTELTDDETDIDPADVALRLTPLDPTRPARDLLEDLLTGIHACWLLHSEYDDEDLEDRDDAQAEEHQNRSRERFAQLVREAAARHRDRLI